MAEESGEMAFMKHSLHLRECVWEKLWCGVVLKRRDGIQEILPAFERVRLGVPVVCACGVCVWCACACDQVTG